MKQFVTALDKQSADFKYLQDFFSKLSAARVKACVIFGPQINKIIQCKGFTKKLPRTENAACNSFVAVVQGFLGNHGAEDYVEFVGTLMKNYIKIGCRMSLKIHNHDAHLDKFKANTEAYPREQDERFCKDRITKK